MAKPTTREIVTAVVVDVAAATGALLIAGGVAMIHLPAGVIVSGALLMTAAALRARRA